MKGIRTILTAAICFGLILSVYEGASAQSRYKWPLPASRELTSGFGQWRSGHFHSGIDIRTFGKTGYKCVAIGDGYVERIVTRWDGYGKALYLKLDDGRMAVYAHLQKFTHELNVYVQEQQLATGRYWTNLYPEKDQFRFKAGDVVAYTGQSGAGAPHLHFEIRDPESRPLSPLQFYSETMKDTRPPVVRAIHFRPLDPVRARIDGQAETVEVDLGTSGGKYVSYDPAVIYGPVGVEIDCVDLRPGTRRNYAVCKVEMFIDNEKQLFFSTVYDTLTFDRWGEVNLETNYSRAIEGSRFVRNLYIIPGAKVPLVNDIAVNNGIIEAVDTESGVELTPGRHILKFKLEDERNNITHAEVHIDLRESPELIAISSADSTTSPASINEDFEYSYAVWDRISDSFQPEIRGESARKLVEYLSGDVTMLSSFRDLAGKIILLTATDSQTGSVNARFSRLVRVSNTGMPMFAPSGMIPHSAIAEGAVGSWYSSVSLDVSELADALDDLTASAASVCIALDVFFDPADSSVLVSPSDVSVPDIIGVQFGKPFTVKSGENSGTIAVFGGGRLLFEGTDLNHSAPICVDTTTLMVKKYGASSAIVTSPRDLLLEDFVELEFDLPNGTDTSGLAVFSISDNGGASIVPCSIREDSVMVAKIGRMGTYALMRDSRGPIISRVTPGDGGTVRSNRPKITFVMDDELAGIGDDRDVNIEVDGVWAIPEYDPETNWMVTYSSQELKPGHHVLNITVYDRVGNKTSYSSTFKYNP